MVGETRGGFRRPKSRQSNVDSRLGVRATLGPAASWWRFRDWDQATLSSSAILKDALGVQSGSLEFGDLGVDPVYDRLDAPSFALAGRSAGVVGAQGVDDLIERQAYVLQDVRHPDASTVASVNTRYPDGRRCTAGSTPRKRRP
jgi:hypothetical protein